ncbi:unnamed protein product [Haemonchus placei]|uniref:UBC core domain-containing protein n=1 Tax=Haemonchus placei TaxID=6290 RepID=A0A3P7TFF8_HAEPC|nr:unnamed protein product [Haemonchus placei]
MKQEPLSPSRSFPITWNIFKKLYSARVCRQPIDGMYIVPSAEDQFRWFGLLFVRRGVFGGGIFRFNVKIPYDFPNTTSLPVVKFDLFIFHPNIDPFHRRPDLSRYFPEGWKKDKHHIQNVLLVVQRLFFSFDFEPDSCANPSAAITWREDKEKSMAKTCVNQSRMEVYDEPEDANDPNFLQYFQLITEIYAIIKGPLECSLLGRGETRSSLGIMLNEV